MPGEIPSSIQGHGDTGLNSKGMGSLERRGGVGCIALEKKVGLLDPPYA